MIDFRKAISRYRDYAAGAYPETIVEAQNPERGGEVFSNNLKYRIDRNGRVH